MKRSDVPKLRAGNERCDVHPFLLSNPETQS